MLKRISNEQFWNNLKKNKLENISVIKKLEKILIDNRGYIFRMPKQHESVILLLSGGLDSVTCWDILMREYHLNVYPISFDRGERRASKEKKSIETFSKLYKAEFPDLFHEPIRLNLGLKPISIGIKGATKKIHPNVIMSNFTGQGNLLSINLSFGSFLMLPIYAKVYAEHLYHSSDIKIRSIFCAVTTNDGLLVPHQTFTALRSIMTYLCTASCDYSWQFTSVIFEKQLGLYFSKAELVKWANRHHLPLEKSWTCYHSSRYQCGGDDCITCGARRDAFLEAKIDDKTQYYALKDQRLLPTLKRIIKKILRYSTLATI